MNSRTGTLASKGRNPLRSAVGEAVASGPAKGVVASIRASGRRSLKPIWVSLGAVVALSAALIVGAVLRTGTPDGNTSSAASVPGTVTTPAAQAPAVPPSTVPIAAQTSAPATPTDTGTPVSTWDKVAQCESGGNWATSTGNGFHGGLQFTTSTWRSFGGSGVPHQASRTEQIAVAERVLAAQGWKAWPACSRKLGLR
jgi:hypothetical protein